MLLKNASPVLNMNSSFPINAIQYCLTTAGIQAEDLDILALPSLNMPGAFYAFFDFPESYTQVSHKAVVSQDSGQIESEEVEIKTPTGPLANSPILPLYQKAWKLSKNCQVHLIEHHLAHAASAAFTSGVHEDNCVTVTLDGIGDKVSAAVWSFDGKSLCPLIKYDGKSSIGWFYASATEALNWRQSSDEWKVMGLAPYGSTAQGSLDGLHPVYRDGVLVSEHDYGSFGRWHDHGAVHYHSRDSISLKLLVQKLGRENFAAEVQRVAEEQALEFILPWLKKMNSRTLLCAGGFFLNIKLNQSLWDSGLIDRQWVYPNAGDSGLPVGCILFASQYKQSCQHRRLQTLYKGPEFTDPEIGKILKDPRPLTMNTLKIRQKLRLNTWPVIMSLPGSKEEWKRGQEPLAIVPF